MRDAEGQDRWLDWVRRLGALAQNGLTFATNPYDVERYTELREIAAQMLAARSGQELAVVERIFAHDTGYATPKVDVRGVVFRGDEILMVRERSDGFWSLPGGWADVGQGPAESVVREIRDESGYETRAVKLLAVYDREKHPHAPPFPVHVYKLFFLCELTGGTARESSETDAAGFFAEDKLPELSITRITKGQVERMFVHHRKPGLPTDFD